MAFDWNDLKYFLAVARAGKLTEAARRMGTDHATVSRRVAALEERLGTILFDRSPRGYALTGAGERLLSFAETMEGVAARAHDEIAGEKVSLSGAVRIGAPDGFGVGFLAGQVGDLVARHPQLEVEIVAMPRVFSLSRREADIAVSLERPSKGRLFSRKLTDYSLHIYGARDYLANSPPIDAVRDLREHRLIGYIPDMIFTQELNYLSQIVGDLAPNLSSTNLLAQREATERGAGLCVLPDFLVRDRPDLIPVLPSAVELIRTFWLIAHMDARDSARIQTVMNFIAERVRDHRNQFLQSFEETAWDRAGP